MRSDEDVFHDWLDDLVEGRRGPTPASGSTEMESAISAAAVLHDLAAPDSETNGDSSWKELVMQVRQTNSGVATMPIARAGKSNLATFNQIASVAAIIAVVAGLVGTAWMFRDTSNEGGDTGQQQLVAATGSPEPERGVDFQLPRIGDCTVEALSTEQVIEKIDTIDTTLVAMFPDDSNEITITENAEGTPVLPEEPLSFQEVSPEISEEIIAAQRQYLACSLLSAPGQRFALDSNNYLQKLFINRSLPVIDSDAIRSGIESIVAEESIFESGAFSWEPELTNVWLPMVSDDQIGLQYIDNNQYQVSIQVRWMMFDGTVTHFEAELPEGMGELERSLPDVWTFVQDEETGVWQLDSMRNARDVISPRRY